MKTFRFILCVTLFALFVSGCQSKSPLVPKPGEESMKGYELYSWEKDGEWYFSLLIGTNREKTADEIQAADAALKGMDELKTALESIPAGQFITWLARDQFTFPPEDIIQKIMEVCKRQGLELNIAR